jgi:hypothetical protein
MIESLDQEVDRLGVSRQSVIKFWVSECLTSRSGKIADKSPDPRLAPVMPSAGQMSRRI